MPELISRMPRSRGGQVAVLGDAQKAALLVADDAAVALRVVHLGGEDGDAVAVEPVALHQLLERGRAQQRDVAVEDEAVGVGRFGLQQRRRHHHRVAGAELRLLQGELDAGRAAWRRSTSSAWCPTTTMVRASGSRAAVSRTWPSRERPVDLVEDLGQVGVHPRALAGGEDEADPAARRLVRDSGCGPACGTAFIAALRARRPLARGTRAREDDVVDEPGLAHEDRPRRGRAGPAAGRPGGGSRRRGSRRTARGPSPPRRRRRTAAVTWLAVVSAPARTSAAVARRARWMFGAQARSSGVR